MKVLRGTHDADPRTRGAHPGQVIIMFAIFSTAMIGVLGLATDLGLSFAGRRTMQNAADAAAYAGARKVAKAATTTGIAALADVTAMAQANGYALADSPGASVDSCIYVNDANSSQGSCNNTVPSGATGVKVTISETHPTFFMRVVPGAPDESTTSATATVHVRKLSSFPSDGPFIVCGTNTQIDQNGNATMSIMTKVSGVWQINSSAVNQTFKIHGPQIQRCGMNNGNYKGVADQDANEGLSAPPEQYFNYKEGDTAGPVSADVQGAQGCQAGEEIDNCVAFLPIAVIDASHPPVTTGSDKKLWTIGYAAFYITVTGANTHSGKLIGNYIVKGPASAGWTPGYLGPIVLKLTS